MLRHTLTVIFRQLKKQWLFTGIHTLGLTVGFSCCLLIFLFIRYELSFDQHHAQADQIYRVNTLSHSQGSTDYSSNTPYPFAAAFRNDVPDVEAVTMVHRNGATTARLADQEVVEVEEVLFVEPTFFDLFDLELQQDMVTEAFAAPGKALLSASEAERLFGAAPPIGQVLALSDTVQLEVIGVYSDIVPTTHLQADMLVSYTSLSSDMVGFDIEDWGVSVGGRTYVLLSEEQQADQLTGALASFAKKYMDGEEDGYRNELLLQPLSAIHFDTRFKSDSPVVPIRPIYLWVFGSIGVLILLMACFNFVNLSLAQSIRKSQEVGMRKVLGAGQRQLWLQYWGEALTLATIAGGLSLLIAQLILPGLNTLLGKDLSTLSLLSWPSLLFALAVLLTISLLAGGYPAWSLARRDPKEVLKSSKMVGSRGENYLRSMMVLTQFVITLVIIISAVTVARQVRYMQNRDLGFTKEAIIQVGIPEPGTNESLLNEWSRHPAVQSVTFTLGAPTSNNNIHTSFYPKGADQKSATRRVGIKAADPEYLRTYGLELLQGRFLNEADARKAGDSFPTGEATIVVNETLAEQIGYANTAELIGKRLIISINNVEAEVVGIVRDFNTTSLREAVKPTILMPIQPLYYEAGLKIDPNQLNSLLPVLEQSWKAQYPNAIFDYAFLDETIAEQYADESQIYGLLRVFAGLAIFIACLGLFGLAAIMVSQRQKEIGLRKVLGASVAGLVGLLSKDLLRLVLIALVIATPLAWWALQQWLQNFAYHVNIGWWVFLLAGLVLSIIAFLTVSGQALKAALANPVDALRSE